MPALFQLIVTGTVGKQRVAVLDPGREKEAGMNAV
jgi:hypothetical protein